MAQHAFIQQIAFMEGLRGITPPKETLPVMLENINTRLIELERLCRRMQPPTVVPDWESLRYRTMRLWRGQFSCALPLEVSCDSWWPSTETGDDMHQSTAVVLERVLRSLGIVSYSAALEAKGGSDDGDSPISSSSSSSSSSNDQFYIAAQEFCHLAGRHRRKPSNAFHTVRELYAAALELCLVLEGQPPSFNPITPPGSYPGMTPAGPQHVMGPPRIIPVEPPKKKKKKKCKSCEKRKKSGGLFGFMCSGRPDDSDSDSDSDSGSDDESIRAKKGWRRWLPGWSWLSKDRKKRRNGYVTDSSGYSSTLADD